MNIAAGLSLFSFRRLLSLSSFLTFSVLILSIPRSLVVCSFGDSSRGVFGREGGACLLVEFLFHFIFAFFVYIFLSFFLFLFLEMFRISFLYF